MRHKSNNKTRPLFTLSLEMTRLVNETRLLLVPCFNSDIYGTQVLGATCIVVDTYMCSFQNTMHLNCTVIHQDSAEDCTWYLKHCPPSIHLGSYATAFL